MSFASLTLALILAAASAAWSAVARPAAFSEVTVVYVVRHAEKSQADPKDRDPGLSSAGESRAQALARLLEDASIDAVFATEFKRTQLTVAPVAASHEIAVTIAQARDPGALAARIAQEFAGKSVLVAGHSNTVPALLKALGVAEAPPLAESDYGDLFIVTRSGQAPPALVHLQYGGPASTDALRPQLADEAAQLLDEFHDAAAKADEERYFGCFAPDGIFLGTDATERWTLEEFKVFAMPYFQGESAWVYTPGERRVSVSEDLAWAWFDEQLESAKYGGCRGTGVLHRSGGRWRIVQYHLTMPIPNDLAQETAERIAAHRTGAAQGGDR